jgi:uncharacterized membrane protein
VGVGRRRPVRLGLREVASYLAYAVTFLFIGQVRANHHIMVDHVRLADRAVLLLNANYWLPIRGESPRPQRS